MFNWVNPKTKLKRSEIDNFGLFATRPIRIGEKVAIWGGYVLPKSKALKLFSKNERHETPTEISASSVEDGFVSASLKEEELDKGDFINHSCDPNCGIKGQITLIAIVT